MNTTANQTGMLAGLRETVHFQNKHRLGVSE